MSGAALVAGCGGGGGTTKSFGVLQTGAYSASLESRAVGDRLDMDISSNGVSVSGFARLRTASFTYLKSNSVTGSPAKDGLISIDFPANGTLVLKRRGLSNAFDVVRTNGTNTENGVMRLASVPATQDVTGTWKGTWLDGSTPVQLDLRFIYANHYVQVTGTVTSPTETGRVTRGIATLVGDRFEILVEMKFDNSMIERNFKAEGTISNNTFAVGSSLSIKKQ